IFGAPPPALSAGFTNGSTHEQDANRNSVVPYAFRRLRDLSVRDRTRRARESALAARRACRARRRRLPVGHCEPDCVRAFRRRIAGRRVYAGAYRQRQARARPDQMSQGDTRALPPGERTWLEQGPLARLLDVLDAGNAEARVVGGAVRN